VGHVLLVEHRAAVDDEVHHVGLGDRTGVVELPRLMLFESAPALGPELSADTSAGIVVSMSASAAMRSWIEPSLAKMSARSRSDWRESTVDRATANALAGSMASVTELLVGYCGPQPAPAT